MDISRKQFGYYLKKKRQQLGLSQADLSVKTNIQRTSISRLESSAGNPQWSMIQRIAEEGMGISVAELFQVEPIEARTPVILVEGKGISNLMNSELLIKTHGRPVPILKGDTPLRSKLIEEKHIAGYFVIDELLIPEVKEHKIVIWPIENSDSDVRFCLVDMEDAEIRDGESYLVDLERIEMRKALLARNGAIILEPFFSEGGKKIVLWGRGTESVSILGRIVILGMEGNII